MIIVVELVEEKSLVGVIERPDANSAIQYLHKWVEETHPDETPDIMMAKCGCEFYFNFQGFSYYAYEPKYL